MMSDIEKRFPFDADMVRHRGLARDFCRQIEQEEASA